MTVTYKWYNGEAHRTNILKCFLLFILNSYRNYIDVGYNDSKLYTFCNIGRNGTLYTPAEATGYDIWMQTGSYYLGYYNWTQQTIS